VKDANRGQWRDDPIESRLSEWLESRLLESVEVRERKTKDGDEEQSCGEQAS
jgi:hypothetical protein